MIDFLNYKPDEQESEKASNSYLMSLIAGISGIIFPLINFIASFYFLVVNRRGSCYVRWHCVQALISQLTLLILNSITFTWTMSVIFGNEKISNSYFAFIFTTILVGIIEMTATIFAAIQIRKGIHVKFYIFGDIVDKFVNKENFKQ